VKPLRAVGIGAGRDRIEQELLHAVLLQRYIPAFGGGAQGIEGIDEAPVTWLENCEHTA